jgi:fructoselysine-6-P-deglycase FrlB-like protein
VDELAKLQQVTYVGTRWTVGLAHEAGLKQREAASAWTEAYPAMDYRHGPIAIAQPGRGLWIFGEPPASLLEDVEATGATIVYHPDLDPMASLVVAQRVAVAKALALGLNPDHPRSLTRSVILT